MKYRTRDEEYDLTKLNEKELDLFDWLMKEYHECRSWLTFEQRTAHGIAEAAKKYHRDEWQKSPLYKIQSDMRGNIGVRCGELNGELSDMIVQ